MAPTTTGIGKKCKEKGYASVEDLMFQDSIFKENLHFFLHTHKDSWEKEHCLGIDECKKPNRFVLSNQFSYHICGYKDYFNSMKRRDTTDTIDLETFTNETRLVPRGVGTIKIKSRRRNGEYGSVELENVYYVPKAVNVLSYKALRVKNWQLKHKKHKFQLKDENNKILFDILEFPNGVYCLDFMLPEVHIKYASKAEDEFFRRNELSQIWHLRTAHMDLGPLLCSDKPINLQEYPVSDCAVCVQTPSFNEWIYETTQLPENAGLPKQHFYVDTSEFTNSEYLVTLQDRISGYVVGFTAKDSDELYTKICRYWKNERNRQNFESLTLCSQTRATFQTLGKKLNKVSKSVPEPRSDDYKITTATGESKCHIFVDKYIRRMMGIYDIELTWWYHLVDTACCIHNILTRRETDNKTAYEIFENRKLNFKGMKVVGCNVLHNLKDSEGQILTTTSRLISTFTEKSEFSVYNREHNTVFEIKYGVFFEEDLITINPYDLSTLKTKKIEKVVFSNFSIHSTVSHRHFDVLFYELALVESNNIDALKTILQPANNVLIRIIELCKLQIVTDAKDNNYPESDMLSDFDLVNDIQQNFVIKQVQNDANSLFASFAISIFGYASWLYLIRLAILKHVLDNFEKLSLVSTTVTKVDVYRIVDILKDKLKGPPADILVWIFSNMTERPIIMHKVDILTKKASIDIFFTCPSSDVRLRQAIFINQTDGFYYEPMLLKNQTAFPSVQVELHKKANRRFTVLTSKYDVQSSNRCTSQDKNCDAKISSNACKVPLPSKKVTSALATLVTRYKSPPKSGMPTNRHFADTFKKMKSTIDDASSLLTSLHEEKMSYIRQRDVSPVTTDEDDILETSEPEQAHVNNIRHDENAKLMKGIMDLVLYDSSSSEGDNDETSLLCSTTFKSDSDDSELNEEDLTESEHEQDDVDREPASSNDSTCRPLRAHRQRCPFLSDGCVQLCETEHDMKEHLYQVHNIDREYATITGNQMRKKYQAIRDIKLARDRKQRKENAIAVADNDDWRNENPVKPHNCDQCDKSYLHQSSLNRHIYYIHTVENHNLLECEVCGRPFNYRTNMQNHLKTHKGNTGKYICPVCKAGYDRAGNAGNHLKIKHPIEYLKNLDAWEHEFIKCSAEKEK